MPQNYKKTLLQNKLDHLHHHLSALKNHGGEEREIDNIKAEIETLSEQLASIKIHDDDPEIIDKVAATLLTQEEINGSSFNHQRREESPSGGKKINVPTNPVTSEANDSLLLSIGSDAKRFSNKLHNKGYSSNTLENLTNELGKNTIHFVIPGKKGQPTVDIGLSDCTRKMMRDMTGGTSYRMDEALKERDRLQKDAGTDKIKYKGFPKAAQKILAKKPQIGIPIKDSDGNYSSIDGNALSIEEGYPNSIAIGSQKKVRWKGIPGTDLFQKFELMDKGPDKGKIIAHDGFYNLTENGGVKSDVEFIDKKYVNLSSNRQVYANAAPPPTTVFHLIDTKITKQLDRETGRYDKIVNKIIIVGACAHHDGKSYSAGKNGVELAAKTNLRGNTTTERRNEFHAATRTRSEDLAVEVFKERENLLDLFPAGDPIQDTAIALRALPEDTPAYNNKIKEIAQRIEGEFIRGDDEFLNQAREKYNRTKIRSVEDVAKTDSDLWEKALAMSKLSSRTARMLGSATDSKEIIEQRARILIDPLTSIDDSPEGAEILAMKRAIRDPQGWMGSDMEHVVVTQYRVKLQEELDQQDAQIRRSTPQGREKALAAAKLMIENGLVVIDGEMLVNGQEEMLTQKLIKRAPINGEPGHPEPEIIADFRRQITPVSQKEIAATIKLARQTMQSAAESDALSAIAVARGGAALTTLTQAGFQNLETQIDELTNATKSGSENEMAEKMAELKVLSLRYKLRLKGVAAPTIATAINRTGFAIANNAVINAPAPATSAEQLALTNSIQTLGGDDNVGTGYKSSTAAQELQRQILAEPALARPIINVNANILDENKNTALQELLELQKANSDLVMARQYDNKYRDLIKQGVEQQRVIDSPKEEKEAIARIFIDESVAMASTAAVLAVKHNPVHQALGTFEIERDIAKAAAKAAHKGAVAAAMAAFDDANWSEGNNWPAAGAGAGIATSKERQDFIKEVATETLKTSKQNGDSELLSFVKVMEAAAVASCTLNASILFVGGRLPGAPIPLNALARSQTAGTAAVNALPPGATNNITKVVEEMKGGATLDNICKNSIPPIPIPPYLQEIRDHTAEALLEARQQKGSVGDVVELLNSKSNNSTPILLAKHKKALANKSPDKYDSNEQAAIKAKIPREISRENSRKERMGNFNRAYAAALSSASTVGQEGEVNEDPEITLKRARKIMANKIPGEPAEYQEYRSAIIPNADGVPGSNHKIDQQLEKMNAENEAVISRKSKIFSAAALFCRLKGIQNPSIKDVNIHKQMLEEGSIDKIPKEDQKYCIMIKQALIMKDSDLQAKTVAAALLGGAAAAVAVAGGGAIAAITAANALNTSHTAFNAIDGVRNHTQAAKDQLAANEATYLGNKEGADKADPAAMAALAASKAAYETSKTDLETSINGATDQLADHLKFCTQAAKLTADVNDPNAIATLRLAIDMTHTVRDLKIQQNTHCKDGKNPSNGPHPISAKEIQAKSEMLGAAIGT